MNAMGPMRDLGPEPASKRWDRRVTNGLKRGFGPKLSERAFIQCFTYPRQSRLRSIDPSVRLNIDIRGVMEIGPTPYSPAWVPSQPSRRRRRGARALRPRPLM